MNKVNQVRCIINGRLFKPHLVVEQFFGILTYDALNKSRPTTQGQHDHTILHAMLTK
jgi:hypothetical protein